MTVFSTLLSMSLLVAQPAAAAPEEGDTEALERLLGSEVTAVSRRVERAGEAAGTVEVITAEEFRQQGHRTLADVLRTVPGVFVHDDRMQILAGVRGFGLLGDYTTRLLVLVDGHAVNTQLGMSSSLGFDSPVDLSAVERIEVVKGPASAVYGAWAFFGVVNIVTRSGADIQGGEVGVRAGSHVLREGRVLAGRRLQNGIDAMASVKHLDVVGPDHRFAEHEGTASGQDAERASAIYGRASWRGASVTFNGFRRNNRLPTAPFDTVFGSDYNRFVTSQFSATAGWKTDPGKPLGLSVQANANRYTYDDYLDYSPEMLFRDRAWESWQGAKFGAAWRVSPRTHVQAGTDLSWHRTRMRSFAIGSEAAVPTVENRFDTQTVFAEVEQRLSARLRATAGATWFRHSLFDERVTPKLALVWAAGGDTTVKVLYGEGFRTPTIFEAYFEDGTDFIGNPELRPEHGRNAEVSLDRIIGGRVRGTLSAHAGRYSGLINQYDSEVSPGEFRSQFLNKGTIETWGTEAVVRAELGRGWFLRAAHAWSTARSEVGGRSEREPSNFPSHVANASLLGTVAPATTVAVRSVWLSARRRDLSDAENAASPGAVRRVPPRLEVGTTLRHGFTERATVELAVENLFDDRSPDPVVADHKPITSIPNDSRTFRVGVEYRF